MGNSESIGIVGVGNWGKNYLPTLQELGTGQIFITDTDPEARARFSQYPIVSFEEMLDNPDINRVVIATPDDTHYQLALAALRHKKDVLVEKPMTPVPEEAEEMLRVSEREGRILCVGHTALYTESFEKLRYAVEQGALGKICRVEAVRTSRGRKGVNILDDLLPHTLAMAITLFGEPQDIIPEEITAGSVVFKMIFPNGIKFTGIARWQAPPFCRRFTVFGTRGVATCSEPVGASRRISNLPLVRQCQDFLFSCEKRRRPLSDGVLGIKVTRCIGRLKRAIAGGSVTLSGYSGL